MARGLGLPNLVIATIPHPYSWSGLSREDVKDRAAGVLDQVVGGLTGKARGQGIEARG
ncbi:MAG: hypothetical protein HYX92_04865 [Chloroflexi bacterium]|nr:hypothetical protein [Chloroflexota bacterium]